MDARGEKQTRQDKTGEWIGLDGTSQGRGQGRGAGGDNRTETRRERRGGDGDTCAVHLPVAASLKCESFCSCSGVRCSTRSSPVELFFTSSLFTDRFSHTMIVSTELISSACTTTSGQVRSAVGYGMAWNGRAGQGRVGRTCSVSCTMKQYLPVSCEISSKYLCSSRFSCTSFTLARHSADSSMAWLKPGSMPYDTSCSSQAGGRAQRDGRREGERERGAALTTVRTTAFCSRGSNMSD